MDMFVLAVLVLYMWLSTIWGYIYEYAWKYYDVENIHNINLFIKIKKTFFLLSGMNDLHWHLVVLPT